ncbi:hypothetical protein [Phenylobacterium glaciei]|uniref:hypothetical protein n=1 Tax=Phenylobacterium glaciei TaxID=2803784 RepID=UPI00201CA085|nr:hypothetical protein [Phenylobacterium glaciei]
MNTWIRQVHRWVCIAFTAGVTANIVAIFVLKQAKPNLWVGLSALLPLILLLLTGLYMFVLPYAARWRAQRPAGGSE